MWYFCRTSSFQRRSAKVLGLAVQSHRGDRWTEGLGVDDDDDGNDGDDDEDDGCDDGDNCDDDYDDDDEVDDDD